MGTSWARCLVREPDGAFAQHGLAVTGRAAAELHDLAAEPAIWMDLTTTSRIDDPTAADRIHQDVMAAARRTTSGSFSITNDVRGLSIRSTGRGPQVTLRVATTPPDRLTTSHVRLPPDGPIVTATSRSGVARQAGLAWWRDPFDKVATVEMSLAADRVGLTSTTSGWPADLSGMHETALRAAPGRMQVVLPMLSDARAEQARRGLQALTQTVLRQQRRSR